MILGVFKVVILWKGTMKFQLLAVCPETIECVEWFEVENQVILVTVSYRFAGDLQENKALNVLKPSFYRRKTV